MFQRRSISVFATEATYISHLFGLALQKVTQFPPFF